ncbi:uncharacterized protein HD556DRAFT_1304073 [Suillus plorans]|uniref:Uncharacterized protein n=1 Tax=Suillus plorans TaxID=116603 RepID=A0A9P7J511_9AGAM|nr:uncharacterized protein HD556DRAFT_1304073 [Suillus plorans]KAG1802806.1 hypothetical protein HD556DRAFT_1304073 [Suillus plorans]
MSSSTNIMHPSIASLICRHEDRLACAHYLTARYHQNPTRQAPFNSAQLNWLRERIPTYMIYHPKSDKTRHFIRSTVIKFDILWPFRQKLWPGSTAETPFTDDMHARLLALSWIVQTNIASHMLWKTHYQLRREKNQTGMKPAKWFWYWGVGQT